MSSIASEIQDLNTNLQNAKDAVTAKGGTVGDTGLAGLAAEIATIPGSQPEPPTSSEAHLTAYDSSTGVITGENLGTTAGTIYMLDRDTHTYIAQPTSSWTNTSVTLTTPLDLANLQGTTSIVAVLPSGMWSTKLLVTGQVAVPGWGVVYRQDPDTRVITKITLESSTAMDPLYSTASTEGWSPAIVLNGETYYRDEIVGFQFGEDFSATTMGNQAFLAGMVNLNQPVVFPDAVTFIETKALSYCYNFNQPVHLPTSLVSTPGSFLASSNSFNQSINIPSSVTSIASGFLNPCISFNQPLTIPSGVTSIGDHFLQGCISFNQPITMPNTVTSVGTYFLAACESFNSPLTISTSLTSISDRFLYTSPAFNQPLEIPDAVTSIGQYFLSGYSTSQDASRMMSFNNSLTLSSHVTTIPNYFLGNCHAFNQPLEIPDAVTSIGQYFLYNCVAFNQPLTMPSGLTSVGRYFMNRCTSFNRPLSFPATFTGSNGPLDFLCYCSSFNSPLTFAGTFTNSCSNFMRGCSAFNQPIQLQMSFMAGSYCCDGWYNFNQPIVLSSIPQINPGCFRNWKSFNQPLTIPSGVTSLGNYVFQNCYALSSVNVEATVTGVGNSVFAQDNNTCKAYAKGITLTGAGATALKASLPDLTSGTYRKLIDGTV